MWDVYWLTVRCCTFNVLTWPATAEQQRHHFLFALCQCDYQTSVSSGVSTAPLGFLQPGAAAADVTCTTSRGPTPSLSDPAPQATLWADASGPSGTWEHRENIKPVLMCMTPCTWSCKLCSSVSHAARQTSTFYSANTTMKSKWVWLVLWNCMQVYIKYLFGKGVAENTHEDFHC